MLASALYEEVCHRIKDRAHVICELDAVQLSPGTFGNRVGVVTHALDGANGLHKPHCALQRGRIRGM